MRRIRATLAALAVAGGLAAAGAAPAQAAPQGRVDPGATLFSTFHGTGCTYPMTVAVNSSGWVSFWEKSTRKNAKPIFLGRALPDGGLAAVTWRPRHVGIRKIYATQNGRQSRMGYVEVAEGFPLGPGSACITRFLPPPVPLPN
ncbi:MAG: hypothetical protein QM658_11410 [Gordonia sp. (in: high G+C Gram-positive bacteria)]